MSEWISVKDRLPNEDGQYLVICELFEGFRYNRILSFAKKYKGYQRHLCGKTIWYFNDSEYGDCESDTVIYWMPLPEPPKEDRKMLNEKCKNCFCRKCIENAENTADGMCRNCEACKDNDFKYCVNRFERCEMHE